MNKVLKVLIVEDNQDDLDLLLDALRRGGYKPHYKCVDNRQAMSAALTDGDWDVVLTDCHMPRFSGAQAIDTIRNTLGLDIPVIVVSGTIGEETAVEMIKAGAHDYVLKDKLARLPVAIARELGAARSRADKLTAESQRVLDRENFISIVAHDLRAPVQRIETMVNLLRSDYESQFDEDGRDIVFRIERSAVRLRMMLASLMAYSRHGRGATHGKVASLPNTIEEVLDNAGIDRTNASFKVTLGDITWVKGDAILIGHVFQNLIGNAVKFKSRDKPLVIELEAVPMPGGKVLMSVTDNGIGIEPRFADKVFDIFCRLHDDDEYEGTGIGLAICKKIVNDHGGTIWIDKEYTGGTRVWFTTESADLAESTAPAGAAVAVG